MQNEIRELDLGNGKRVFVEVDVEKDIEFSRRESTGNDLPTGAEPTGLREDALESMKMLKENISNLSESVYDSLQHLTPSEWSVEMTMGFKGKTTPIPFIASGEINGGIKVKVTWKKDL